MGLICKQLLIKLLTAKHTNAFPLPIPVAIKTTDPKSLGGISQGLRLDTDTLPAHDVEHQLRRSVVLVDLLGALECHDILNVLIKEVGAVHRATLGFGMELGREDGARGVAHALVTAIVQVDEVLFPIAGQAAGINGVTMVLAGNVALASSDIQRGDVVSPVTVLELDGASTNSQSKKLVSQADAHDGNLRRLHQGAEVVHGLLTVSGVTGAVGDEDTIEVVGHLLDLEVVREHGHTGASADQTAEDVLLDTTVD